MKRKYMEAFPQTMGPPAIITPGTSGKKKKGKSERAKLVEKLAYQNMKVYERLHAAGIMETPKDLSGLDNFIKQGQRSAIRQAADTQRTLGLLQLEKQMTREHREREEMADSEADEWKRKAKAECGYYEARQKQLNEYDRSLQRTLTLADNKMTLADKVRATADNKMTVAKELHAAAKQQLSESASRRCISCDRTRKETGTCYTYVICDACSQWKPNDEAQST